MYCVKYGKYIQSNNVAVHVFERFFFSCLSAAPFGYTFWLSHDPVLSRDTDIPLTYNVPDGLPYTEPLTSDLLDLDLSGTSVTGLLIPATLDRSICGKVYLIADLDPDGAVMDSNKENNMLFVETQLSCSEGECKPLALQSGYRLCSWAPFDLLTLDQEY